MSNLPKSYGIGISVLIWTDNVDSLHEEFVSRGVQIDMRPTDQVWGLRDIHARDTDENKLTFAKVLQTEQ